MCINGGCNHRRKVQDGKDGRPTWLQIGGANLSPCFFAKLSSLLPISQKKLNLRIQVQYC